MKVAERTNRVELTGDAEEYDFEILATPKMFHMLADNYSNKIRAVIRELSTNAADAHTEAENETQQFDVFVPTTNKPQFILRDYGVGMTKDFMIKTYLGFGKSTRENTNEMVGALGIGSKSPFGYTDSFVVESWKDGEHTIAMMYENDYGYYKARIMVHEFGCWEPNGVKITINVPQDDVYDWQSEAGEVYTHFDILPNFIGFQPTVKQQEYVLTGDDWALCIGHDQYYTSKTARAIMGNIAYPLDFYSSKIPSHIQQFMNVKIDVKFKIGDLSIDNSREKLMYDNRTVNNIVAKFSVIISDLQERVESYFEDCDCLWEARLAHNNINESIPDSILQNMPSDSFKWQGQQVADGYRSKNVYANVGGVTIYQFSPTHTSSRRSTSTTIKPKQDLQFVENDLKIGGQSRTRYLVEKEQCQAVLLKFDSDDARTEFMELLGLLERHIVKASTLDKPPTQARTSSGATRTKLEPVSKFIGSSYVTKAWQNEEKDLSEGGMYVELNRYHPKKPNGEKYDGIMFDSLVKYVEIFTGKDIEVWGVKTSSVKKIDKDKNWVNFFDYVEELCDPATIKAYGGVKARQQARDTFYRSSFELDEDSIIKIISRSKGGAYLSELNDLHERLIVSDDEEEKLDALTYMLTCVEGKSIEPDNTINFDLVERWRQVEDNVPMLAAFPYHHTFTDSQADSLGEYINFCMEN